MGIGNIFKRLLNIFNEYTLKLIILLSQMNITSVRVPLIICILFNIYYVINKH